MASRSTTIAFIVLVLAAILFGSTLIITKLGTQSIPIFIFNWMRYFLAFLCYIPIFGRFRAINKSVIIAAAVTGIANYFLLTLQTFGLQTSTASNGGFITNLYVVLTPIISWLIYKTKIEGRNWIAIVLAIGGMSILFLVNFSTTMAIGDVFYFLAAIACSFQLIYTGKLVKGLDVMLFSMLQLLVTDIMLFISAFIFGENFGILGSVSGNIWIAWLYMGIAATFLPLLFQNYGQQYISPSHTAIIFTLVPVFSTIFGVLIGGETITPLFVLGGSLIICAIFVVSIKRAPPALGLQSIPLNSDF